MPQFCCAICSYFEPRGHLDGFCSKTKVIVNDSTDPHFACSEGSPKPIVTQGEIVEVDVNLIHESNITFRAIDSVIVSDLVLSIKEHGLLQPIMVMKRKDDYEIIFGRHRLIACKQLGFKTIPCFIKQMNEEDAIFLQLAENLQRNMKENCIREGEFFLRLQKQGWSIYKIGHKIGKSNVFVSDRIQTFVRLNDMAKSYLEKHQITPSLAYRIAELPPDKQLEVTKEAIEHKWRIKDFELKCRQHVVNECRCQMCPTHGPMLDHHRNKGRLEDYYFAGSWIHRKQSSTYKEFCLYCNHEIQPNEYVFPLKYHGVITGRESCENCMRARTPSDFQWLFDHLSKVDPHVKKMSIMATVGYGATFKKEDLLPKEVVP